MRAALLVYGIAVVGFLVVLYRRIGEWDRANDELARRNGRPR